MPRTCERLIPEQRIEREPLRMEMQNGELVVIPPVVEVVPEHPCTNEAAMLSRSMKECPDGSWEKTADRKLCASCFVPGRMVHQDGTVTQHPAMALEDA